LATKPGHIFHLRGCYKDDTLTLTAPIHTAPPPNMSSSKPKEFKGQLLKLREARRLADHDAQLLANRIALLEAEEAKAWKKIKQTKVRAETILTKRQQHQQEKQQTRRAVLANRNGAGRPKQRSYVDKSVNDALHRKKKQQHTNKAQKLAQDMKSEQARMQRDRRQQADLTMKKNKARRDQIYKAKKQAIANRDREKSKLAVKNKKIYNQRVGKETTKRVEIEKRVSKMEQLEMELIKRLQNTQQLQQQAYQQLEGALNPETM
jgi:hypothetical protein